MFILTKNYKYSYGKIFKEFDFRHLSERFFNGKMYEQTDVSIGGYLGPVLANIIAIESEKVDC